ncbi:hypothetical protein I0349_000346 [Listeria monocytogenes]|nr:hypothetical protein [Listeria monocytogenes]EGD1642273.1 hypothetical protein [Listeria monocytogenes]EGP9038566.1 hypothetical protein [Listeria monocytogenes]EGS4882418.1 hypothetical protein [Listeria monocytogenes]EGT2114866.1 hypothetical protein [Listeria monocytogenes]
MPVIIGFDVDNEDDPPRLATQARTIPVESVTSPELKSNSSYYTGKNEALQTEKTCDIAKCATII